MGRHVYEGEVFRALSLSDETVRDLTFLECKFIGCSFSGVTLQGCTLRDCTFEGCRIDLPTAREAAVERVTLSGCLASGVQWYEFVSGNRFAPLFSSVRDTTLRYSTFAEMKLGGFDFSGLRILESTFSGCDLAASSFREADLSGSEFFRCDLTKADFRDAVGYRVDVLTSKVRGARFTLPDAIGLLSGLGATIE